MAQGTDHPPTITIDGHVLEAVDDLTYLGSTISSSLTLETEISSRIAKATAEGMEQPDLHGENQAARLPGLRPQHTSLQHRGLDSLREAGEETQQFYLKCLRHILHIRWQDRVTDVKVLQQAGMTSMISIRRERRLRWLGHVRRMDPGCIPRDLL